MSSVGCDGFSLAARRADPLETYKSETARGSLVHMTTVQRERESLTARLRDLDADRDKLLSRLDELTVERDRIGFALDVLQRIDSGRVSTPATEHVVPRPSRRMGATTDFLIRALEHNRVAADVETIVKTMREIGWSAQPANEVETVRAALSRAVRDHLAIRTGHGMYAPIAPRISADLVPMDDTQESFPASGEQDDEELPLRSVSAQPFRDGDGPAEE